MASLEEISDQLQHLENRIDLLDLRQTQHRSEEVTSPDLLLLPPAKSRSRRFDWVIQCVLFVLGIGVGVLGTLLWSSKS
jgi:hypothetical protein